MASAFFWPPGLWGFSDEIVVEVLADEPLGTRAFAGPRLPRIRIVVLGWCLLSFGLDEAGGAQQFDLCDAVLFNVFGDLFEFGLLFLLLGFFNNQIQLTELLLQLANGRAVYVEVSRANNCRLE